MNSLTLTVPDDCKVFTPSELAVAMAIALPNRPGDKWLEPCVGQGVFLSALARNGIERNQVTAIELDCHEGVAEQCGEYHPSCDFLGWSLETTDRFDRVIGNPPYLQLHRLPKSVLESALRIPKPGSGFVPRGANCWYAFLCASLRLLRPGGGLCFVLPSGWEYTDYAVDLRKQMPGLFRRFEVIRSNRSFFQGVLDGCVVLVADGFGEPNCIFRRIERPSLPSVIDYLRSISQKIDNELSSPIQAAASNQEQSFTRFGEIARVRIGVVTGEASYFLLNDSQRSELGLATSELKPVLTRARHLKKSDVSWADWRALCQNGERVWLFWPPPRNGRPSKAVTQYIQRGEKLGLHLRQKTRTREPWYRTRTVPHADGFITGMTPFGPWVSLNRTRDLTATNTLYTLHFLKKLKLCEQAAWSLALVTSPVAEQYPKLGRFYSKGLLKFEPRDVMSLMVPTPVETGSAALGVYQLVINELLCGDPVRARSIADAFIFSGLAPE